MQLQPGGKHAWKLSFRSRTISNDVEPRLGQEPVQFDASGNGMHLIIPVA